MVDHVITEGSSRNILSLKCVRIKMRFISLLILFSLTDALGLAVPNPYQYSNFIYLKIHSAPIFVNTFPHLDAFWRLCSRRLFKNIVTKC